MIAGVSVRLTAMVIPMASAIGGPAVRNMPILVNTMAIPAPAMVNADAITIPAVCAPDRATESSTDFPRRRPSW